MVDDYFEFYSSPCLFFTSKQKQGDIHDRQSLVKAIEQVDVVISAVGRDLLADQSHIIDAIKEAGNIKVRKSFLIFNRLLNILFRLRMMFYSN